MINLEEHFTNTYLNNSWGSSESRSGPGSNRSSLLVNLGIDIIINTINTELKNNDKLIISDVPCGDLNWIELLIFSILEKTHIKNIDYYAYDIVKNIQNHFDNLVKINNVNYYFIHFDATKEIPIKSDIILCKELFIHLSFNDIKLTINNFKKSNSYILICSDHTSSNINNDIVYSELGECRDLSLTLPPFNLNSFFIQNLCYKVWKLKNIII